MDRGTLQGVATLLALTAFLAIAWWAYSGKRRKDFETAARLPLLDDEQKKGH